MTLRTVSAVPGQMSPGLIVPGDPGSSGTSFTVGILTASTSSGVNASSTSP